jgi:hypothetical protein
MILKRSEMILNERSEERMKIIDVVDLEPIWQPLFWHVKLNVTKEVWDNLDVQSDIDNQVYDAVLLRLDPR